MNQKETERPKKTVVPFEKFYINKILFSGQISLTLMAPLSHKVSSENK